MKDQPSNEKVPLKQDESIIKYQNISPASNRSSLQLPHGDQKNKQIEPGLIIKPNEIENRPNAIDGKPIKLQLRPMILQNPNIQLFNPITNYTVCPFCKFSGSFDISYEKSKTQRTCCIILIFLGLFFLAWIPFLIKDLSIQVLKCGNCKKELKQIGDENERI